MERKVISTGLPEVTAGIRASFAGVGATMFLTFIGFSASQFHSYLFENRGVGKLQIGLLLMAGQGAALLSPLFQLASIRRLHGPRLPFFLMLAGAGASLAALPHLHGFRSLLIGFCLLCFCSAGVFPLNAACAFEAMRAHGHSTFFRIRSLGTLGFLAGCVFSVFFPRLSDLPLLYGGFGLCVCLALGVAAWDYRVPAHPAGAPALPRLVRPGILHALGLLRQPRTLKLLAVLGVMNFANAMATGVQGNYLVDRWQQGQRTISLAWVLSTGCEVPLMLLCAWLLRRHGLRAVLAFGLAGTLLKLVGLALAGEVWQYCLALTMHGCFFSGALTGFSVYLDRVYQAQDRPSLQVLAPIFYGGIPSSLAGLAAGWLWHAYSLRVVYGFAGGIAVLASLYAFWLFREPADGRA